MEIQLWEGAALKCAETALRGTTHDKVSAKSDSGPESVAKTVGGEARRRDRSGDKAQQ
jgi:hypothetical protein